MIARAVEDVLANEVQFMSARLADNGDEQVRVSSGDEGPARGMPPDVAVNGGRGGTAVTDRTALTRRMCRAKHLSISSARFSLRVGAPEDLCSCA